MFEDGFKRFFDSLDGIPDRVPFIAQMHEFAMKWSRESAKKFYSDPEILVKGHINTASDFGFDIPWLGYDVYNIEAEALGVPMVFSDHAPPEIAKSQSWIRDRNDLDRLMLPKPYSAGRLHFVLEANKIFEKATGYSPPIQFTGPFSQAVILRGYENLIQDIYYDPEFANDLLSFIVERVTAPWIVTLKKESPKAKIFRGADAMASFPLVNIQILKEFAVPYILQLKRLCGNDVTILNWWGEKYLTNPEELLELKLKISPSIIQGQDPDVEEIGAKFYKDFAVRNNAALILGIGNLFLQKADKKAIKSRIAHYIKAGYTGGRFMIYFCNISSKTPVDNLKGAISAVKEFGAYKY